jgi:hypothetical protein
MDFVYVCRQGENEELRYSIRSVLSSFPDATVWVVGAKPDWYDGNFIGVKKERNRYATVEKNLAAIVESAEISEDFVLMNDDFFITHKIDKVETYYSGTLYDMVDRIEKTCNAYNMDRSYLNRVTRTYTYIKNKFRIPQPLNYELHMPMPMQKKKLKDVLGIPALWRSAYGNKHNVAGILSGDVKVYGADGYLSFDYLNGPGPYASSNDDSFEEMKPWLHNLFPNPSKHELDMQ